MERFFSILKRIVYHKDLRNKILYSFALILIFRIIAHIPLPGVDTQKLTQLFQNNQMLGLLDLFSGGSVSRFSLAMLGVGPYITSSIIIQLLTSAVPSLEELQKEGEYGRQKINQYTRYLSIPLALVESFGLLRLLQSQNVIGEINLVSTLLIMITATAGSALIMWLGELVSENGIGNGVSLLIAVGIVAGIPGQIAATSQVLEGKLILAIEMIIAAIAMVVFIVYTNEAERRIPVSYARRIRQGRVTSMVDSYLPIKVNAAGVIPIIFATSILVMPGVIRQALSGSSVEKVKNIALAMQRFFSNELYYGSLFFVLVFAFTFFYTSVIFQPKNIAENLQKQGGFIPGIRPGNQTAEYFASVIYKITFAGAFFLSIIAVFPFFLQSVTKIPTLAIGGTGILIIVSVTLETVRQIKAQLAMRSYDDIMQQ